MTFLHLHVILYVMNIRMTLIQEADGSMFLEAGGEARRVCTVSQAARMLKRTRRQVYRYIKTGVLKPESKLLGEWLLNASEVAGMAERPLAAQPIPKRLAPLFPEYDASKLNAGRDRTLVLARALENGGAGEIKWVFRRYSRKELAGFIEKDGARLLSPRSLRLWSLVVDAVPGPMPEWRSGGPWRK